MNPNTIGATSNVTVELNSNDAELFKEFCKQHELYTAVARLVIDNPGGYVKLLIDENSVVRKIEASRTILFLTK